MWLHMSAAGKIMKLDFLTLSFYCATYFVHKTCSVCFCPILVQSLLSLYRDGWRGFNAEPIMLNYEWLRQPANHYCPVCESLLLRGSLLLPCVNAALVRLHPRESSWHTKTRLHNECYEREAARWLCAHCDKLYCIGVHRDWAILIEVHDEWSAS